MTLSLRYVECSDFPTLELGESVSTKVQLSFSWGQSSASSSLTYLGMAANHDFERYEVLHQVDRDIDAYWNNELVKHVLENRRFPAYLHRKRGYFLLVTNGRNAKGL